MNEMVNDRYCPGQECKLRDKCAIHKSPNITSIWPSTTDWSVFLDNSVKPPTYCCGDNGNYKLFIPLEDKGNPAADVAPVRHGEWVIPVTKEPWRKGFVGMCTNCGYVNSHTEKAPKFCEDCGARMDGGNLMSEKEYEELHCTYCDSQRCLNRNGDTLAEKCPYWEIRMGKGE